MNPVARVVHEGERHEGDGGERLTDPADARNVDEHDSDDGGQHGEHALEHGKPRAAIRGAGLKQGGSVRHALRARGSGRRRPACRAHKKARIGHTALDAASSANRTGGGEVLKQTSLTNKP